MVQLRKINFLLLVILGLIMSCNDSSKSKSGDSESPRIIKNTKLSKPKANDVYKIGEEISFEINSSAAPIDSILIDFNGSISTHYQSVFQVTSLQARTGNQKIRVVAYCGSASETHYARLIFHSDVAPEYYDYEVVKEYPHDPAAYTQGLFFKEDTLIESTGRNGTSYLAKVDLNTAKIYQSTALDNKYFGEGSCFWGGQYIQLTWTGQTGIIYDENLNRKKSFQYTHQGWGITAWGDTLYVSDGTNVIHKLDPRDFTEIGRLEVYDQEEGIRDLNELEMIDGLLYANIYQEDFIAVIDPISGKLLRLIDMSGLISFTERRSTDVLNGIAYRPEQSKIYVTGKLWPKLFEVIFKPKNNPS